MTEATQSRPGQSMRLTYPAEWRRKTDATRFARDNGLRQAGVRAVELEGVWRLVIDDQRAPLMMPWLRTQYPSIVWDVSWTPIPSIVWDVSWTPKP